MLVCFLRHGVAASRGGWNGEDSARPLTDGGVERMKRTARTVAALKLPLSVIITSPLLRALQTAEIIGGQMKIKPVEDARLGPGFNDEMLREILLDHAGADALLLVGHEPDFSNTISAVIGGGRITLKKGGLALVELSDAKSRRGELAWLLPPSVLAR